MNYSKLLISSQFIRFLFVGGLSTLSSYGLFVFFELWLGKSVGYLYLLYIIHLLVSTVTFFVYRIFVYQVTGYIILDYLRFQASYVVPIAANTIALPFMVEILGFNVLIAQGISTIVIAVSSFVLFKYFAFRRKKIVSGQVPNGHYDL